MKKITLFFLICLTSSHVFPQISINEVDVDQDGADDGEFIELFSTTPNASLDGYVLVLFNGNDDQSYDSYDLDGFTTDSNGFFILANDGFPDRDMSLSTLQNGPDAVAIYQDDASSFPNDTPVVSVDLIDALVYGTGDDKDTGLLTGLNETVQYNEDANGFKDIESIQNAHNGTFWIGPPSPNAINSHVVPVSLVSDIATLKSSTVGGSYTLNGEVLLTYQQDFRNQKYIEDGTAAILIDDVDNVITTTYAIGDGISLVTGTLVENDGVLKLVPIIDPGAPTSTGNTLTPQIVSLSQLTNAPAAYGAELIKVLEATVTTADNAITQWIVDTKFAMATADGAFDFRTSFQDANYIGDPLPSDLVDITGIVTRYDSDDDGTAEYFLTARSTADFDESLAVMESDAVSFAMYPNPTKGVLHIQTSGNKSATVEIFNLLGEKVFSRTDINGALNISGLGSGMYLVKISQNEHGVTKKLIVK